MRLIVGRPTCDPEAVGGRGPGEPVGGGLVLVKQGTPLREVVVSEEIQSVCRRTRKSGEEQVHKHPASGFTLRLYSVRLSVRAFQSVLMCVGVCFSMCVSMCWRVL